MHEIAELDRKGLREFALVTAGIVAGLFGLFFPWLLETRIPLWPWLVAGVLTIWGLAAPHSLRLVYRSWMKLGPLLGRITTPIILGIVFYLLIWPMGLVMRLLGHDPMARQLDDVAATYRITSSKSPKENMERPF